MKRREFLTKSAILTAGIGFGFSACKKKFVPPSIPDEDKIRIGIIGLGDRGTAIIHVLNHSPEFKVIACCDILDFRLEQGLQKINNKATGYIDYRKMLLYAGVKLSNKLRGEKIKFLLIKKREEQTDLFLIIRDRKVIESSGPG